MSNIKLSGILFEMIEEASTDNGESGETEATQQAHQLGLVSKGWGNWADPQSGQTVAKTIQGKLVKLEPGENAASSLNYATHGSADMSDDEFNDFMNNVAAKSTVGKPGYDHLGDPLHPNGQPGHVNAMQSAHDNFGHIPWDAQPDEPEYWDQATKDLYKKQNTPKPTIKQRFSNLFKGK